MTERRYRAVPPAMVRRVELGSLTALYDCRAAQSHLLASPLPEMLDVMAGDSVTAADVAMRLATRFDVGGDDASAPEAVAAHIAARLDELAALGLVEGL